MARMEFCLDYKATGADRKRLVKEISNCLGMEAHYLGAPGFVYEVGGFTIDRAGKVSFDYRTEVSIIEKLQVWLAERGFDTPNGTLGDERSWKAENKSPNGREGHPTPEALRDEEPLLIESRVYGLDVILPANTFDAVSLANLQSLVNAKHSLICKALGVEKLPIIATEESVSFPWFDQPLAPEEAGVYARFISALAEMARKQQRVTARDKAYDNDRYAFRCFLLRLGYIGADYKADRKVLLRRLSGSSAFKSGAKNPTEVSEKIPVTEEGEAQ